MTVVKSGAEANAYLSYANTDRGNPASLDLPADVVGVATSSAWTQSMLVRARRELEVSHPIQLVVCAGKCQSWGALDVIDRAAEIWEKAPRFDLVTRQCLDRCDQAAVCELRTPDGTVVLTQATADTVAAALAEVLPAR